MLNLLFTLSMDGLAPVVLFPSSREVVPATHIESTGTKLLLGHTKLESTVRYLGIEVDDALATAGKTEA